jgi:hypothetical protein
LITLEHGMASSAAHHMSRPSAVRVFAKSLHVMAVGWFVCVLWLWGAGLRQHYRRAEALPPDYGADVLVAGITAGLILQLVAGATTRWTGRAPSGPLERREWHHAFWWALCPNLMLLGTVYVMIAAP